MRRGAAPSPVSRCRARTCFAGETVLLGTRDPAVGNEGLWASRWLKESHCASPACSRVPLHISATFVIITVIRKGLQTGHFPIMFFDAKRLFYLASDR